MSLDSLFDGIDKIKVGNQSGTPLTEGEYLLKITDVQHLRTLKKGDAFIAEFEVVETSDPQKHPVGTKRSWYQSMQNQPVAIDKIKKFMLAVLGYEPKRDEQRITTEVDPYIKAWTAAACTQKILNNQQVRCSVVLKQPKPEAVAKAKLEGKEAKAFPEPRFSPVSPNPPPARTN